MLQRKKMQLRLLDAGLPYLECKYFFVNLEP